ncbi:molybdopterin-guanine dinucleotide biosynthesis protein B [Crenobacter intestini]|uniref:Molybdopterin-guanine dinucleotide biosynthesis protein B n=1 Tax=Crenobacter intestini TaxID=2563443 RepID=A0A4T0V7C4_9NEIS|nr:molybdopterin-guanine dinucleotide biosynthesis protein B [Crenobacter intestini]TIC87185.1 molybdopterin-guanine dinucleotide biosynthesis protein B [Crenobacter intestini]
MPKVLGVAGFSGCGKTTLIEALLPSLAARGLTVSVIKHSHHALEVDTPGKDSDRHRKAGANQVLLLGDTRYALTAELAAPLDLAAQLALLSPCDLVLLEGQKWADVDKVEVWRPVQGKPRLAAARVIALASDTGSSADAGDLPLLDLNDVPAIAEFIAAWLARQGGHNEETAA